jgi:hypothetical protein
LLLDGQIEIIGRRAIIFARSTREGVSLPTDCSTPSIVADHNPTHQTMDVVRRPNGRHPPIICRRLLTQGQCRLWASIRGCPYRRERRDRRVDRYRFSIDSSTLLHPMIVPHYCMHPIPRCPILSPNPIGSTPPCRPTLLHADPPSASSQDHEFRISAVGREEAWRSSGMRGILAIIDFYLGGGGRGRPRKGPGDDDDGSIAPARERSRMCVRSAHPFVAIVSTQSEARGGCDASSDAGVRWRTSGASGKVWRGTSALTGVTIERRRGIDRIGTPFGPEQ